MLKITFATTFPAHAPAVVVLIDTQLKLDQTTISLDQQNGEIISKAIQKSHTFTGKFSQKKVLTVTDNKSGDLRTIIIIGTGDNSALTKPSIEELGGIIFTTVAALKLHSVTVVVSSMLGSFEQDVASGILANGLLLASYKVDKYFTRQSEDDKCTVESAEIIVSNIATLAASETSFNTQKIITEGVFLARNYVSEPPNILYPAEYAKRITNELEPLGISVEVFGEHEMKNLGMGALLGVGQGSQHESKMVVMKYIGDKSNKNIPVALAGKGVTFDSGGISLKQSANMWDMKYDMAGSAAVVGAMRTIAARKSRANVVAAIGLVENMPSGNAQRPSDIVKTMSGQTVEVLNTDAEGRLVLADIIWYIQDKFHPKYVIDLATLTGAIVVSLGTVYAGCFANSDELAAQLITAGNKVDEKLWRMPLHKDYDKMIKSDIADIRNITDGGGAGSSTAAHFINRFVKDGVFWAHLDIAGVAWNKKGKPICPKGATGYGVRLLNQYILDYHEV